MMRFLSLSSLGLALLALTAPLTFAEPLHAKFTSCLSDYPSQLSDEALMNVTDVYANIVPADVAQYLGLIGGGERPVLRVDLIGSSGVVIKGFSNETGKLATLFHDTNAAHVSVWESTSWLCPSILPADLPTPYTESATYCPLPAGPFALNISVPLYRSYALTTLRTRVRVVDTTAEANTLLCYDLEYTPWRQGAWYYQLFRWFPVSIAIGIWLATWGARFAAGWVVGSGVAEYEVKEGHGAAAVKREAKMRKWGTMIVSGLSGERLSVSGGLLRFATPGLRDIIQYIQFTTILAMVAVNWPNFAYPIIVRGAWADLVGNVTVISGLGPNHVSGYPSDYAPPSDFAKMMSDTQYPIYLDPMAYNPLFDLHGSAPGMQSFASAIGLRDTDLFGTGMVLFLSIVAGVTLISLLLWIAHAFVEYLSPQRKARPVTYNKRYSSQLSSLNGPTPKEASEGSGLVGLDIEGLPAESRAHISSPSRFRKVWFRFRPKGEAGAFHAAAMYGNLLRLILMFHLPITAFSIYQLTLSRASIVSRVFAALSFVFISVLIPAFIMWKVYKTASGKLYDATRTLLSVGTMYNVYIEGKQMFRVFPLVASLIEGIVIGAGQKSGLAQAVVLIVVELVMLVLAAFWYPWGEGASMGAPNAFLGIIRVISVVLTMLLSTQFAITTTVTDWFTYVILILQAIVFVFFFFMLLTKIVEGLIRLCGGVHFDESTSPLDGGLFAAIMDLDCLNGGRGGKAAARRERKRGSQQLQKNVYAAGSLTTQMMLDRNSQGVPRQNSEGNISYLSSYNSFGDPAQANGYLPVSQPPLGPPPSNSMKRSFEDENANEPIMSGWRPPSTSPPPPSGSGQSFSVLRGGRADMNNPYAVKDGTPSARSYSPAGPSARPISALPSPPQSPMPLLHPTLSNGLRPNNEGLMPPQLSIPKRRSLNDLKEDNSPTSAYPESPKKRPKGKRLSSGPKGWFARRGEDDSPSESEEEDPRRTPQPFAAVPSPLGQKRGWRTALGLTRRQADESDERRDENKVRKDALAAQSGSLFAGVDAPRSGFVVKRKEPKAKGRDYQPWKEGGQRFSLATTGGSQASTPRANQLETLEGGQSAPENGTQGFKVKRMDRGSIAPPLAVPLKAEAPMIQLSPPERPGPGEASGRTSASSSIKNGRTSHGIVKSLPAASLKRSSNVAKSPVEGGSIKSPTGSAGRTTDSRRGSAGGLWGDLGEMGASTTDPNAAITAKKTSKGGPPETAKKTVASPTSPDAGKSFKVRRSKQYTPPIAAPQGTSQPTSSFSVRRPQEWAGDSRVLEDPTPAPTSAYQWNTSTSSGEYFGAQGRRESFGPDRPPKSPRRMSQDSPRL